MGDTRFLLDFAALVGKASMWHGLVKAPILQDRVCIRLLQQKMCQVHCTGHIPCEPESMCV